MLLLLLFFVLLSLLHFVAAFYDYLTASHRTGSIGLELGAIDYILL